MEKIEHEDWHKQKNNLISQMATLQSVSEVGIGSLAYAMNIPFTGHLLSINQIAVLTWTARLSPNRKQSISTCNAVACISSLLKSLSPVGKKLTPMLAISMQGFLYSLGLSIFGKNILGISTGALLSSAWGFIQPICFAYLVFGGTLFSGLEKIWQDLSKTFSLSPQIILWVLITFIISKLTLAIATAIFVWYSKISLLNRYQHYIESLSHKAPKALNRKTNKPAWQQAFLDMLTPWFILSMIFSFFFLFFAQNEFGGNIWLYFFSQTLARTQA